MLPIWMREEMKGTKLTKEDFAIKEQSAIPHISQDAAVRVSRAGHRGAGFPLGRDDGLRRATGGRYT